ncbi:hypothetical protein SAMN04489859_103354 [Paracoccus alcaliphilus]|uniref:Uncharacterized protein n=1 Tax=Paracoccus alcaliphilus TaxID=34002 RepID=A0A1H8LU81_9RHOB|nr:hypothetical protein [Paracoccus alcaliphilus]SEO08426.1 hypothetical protein SAMN04489859_103354 [Paracoccus alcaliphilus]
MAKNPRVNAAAIAPKTLPGETHLTRLRDVRYRRGGDFLLMGRCLSGTAG